MEPAIPRLCDHHSIEGISVVPRQADALPRIDRGDRQCEETHPLHRNESRIRELELSDGGLELELPDRGSAEVDCPGRVPD